MEIINGANAHDAVSRQPRADTVHERAASRTEVVGHGVTRLDGFRLAPGLQVLLAAEVLKVFVVDSEIRCKHGRGDFVTIGTIADEGLYKTGALSGLKWC